MVKERAGQEFLLTIIYIISYSYSNPAECYQVSFSLILLNSYSCGSQVKAQRSSGHIFQSRSCVRRDYPSEVMDIVSYCTKSGRMSQVGVGEMPYHHQVMSDDIDDIQNPR